MDELRKQIRTLLEELADKLVTMTLKEGNRMAMVRLREARLRAGRTEGKIPYGDNPQYPQEKEAVVFMLDLRKKGHSYRVIAETLERHDFRTRHGKSWNPGTVKRIMERRGVR